LVAAAVMVNGDDGAGHRDDNARCYASINGYMRHFDSSLISWNTKLVSASIKYSKDRYWDILLCVMINAEIFIKITYDCSASNR